MNVKSYFLKIIPSEIFTTDISFLIFSCDYEE